MPANHQDLLRMLAPANFTNHVGCLDRSAGQRILHIHADARRNSARDETFQLPLVFSRHRHHGNRKVRIKTQNSRVREVHAGRSRAALPTDNRNRTRLVRRFQKISEARKQHHEILFRLAFLHHKDNLALQFRGVFDFLVDVEQIHGDHFAFRSARHRRTRPAHGVDVQFMRRRRQQLRFRRSPRPPFPDCVLLEMHIFEADGFHLRRAPFFGLAFRGRARYPRSNVIAQFRQILVGVRVHHALAGNARQSRLGSVLIRTFWQVVGQRESTRDEKSHQSKPRKILWHPIFSWPAFAGAFARRSYFLRAPKPIIQTPMPAFRFICPRGIRALVFATGCNAILYRALCLAYTNP